MSEWEPESQGGMTEELDGDETVGDPDDDESGWDETNDEPAEGEQGQDAV